MTPKSSYESPEVEIIETKTEGILCTRDNSGMDMNPEEGNM